MIMKELAKKLDNIYVHCKDPDFKVSHFGADNFLENYGTMKIAVHIVSTALGGIYKELPADPREFRTIIRNLILDRNNMDDQETAYWIFLKNCHSECISLASKLKED